MKKWIPVFVLMLFASGASAAPNRADSTSLGTVQGFPYVVARAGVATTIIRINNTRNAQARVRCQYRDNTGVNESTTILIPGNAPSIFDVSSVFTNGGEGFMFCWTVNAGGNNVVSWNFLAATATIIEGGTAGPKWEYTAWSFGVRDGTAPGTIVPGTTNQIPLDGVKFDKCAQYLMGQYTPPAQAFNNPTTLNTITFSNFARVSAVQCNVDLRQAPPGPASILTPAQTSVTITILNEQGVANTGVNVTCIGTWHNANLPTFGTFGTTRAVAYRLESLGGAFACPGRPALGLIGVQMSPVTANAMPTDTQGSALTIVGERAGLIRW
jgi:hypothetical protein